MSHNKNLLVTVSVIALAVAAALPVGAQVSGAPTNPVQADLSMRTRAETAILYANTLDRLTQIIEQDIGAETGVGVIEGLRAGRIDLLPSLDPDLRALVDALGVKAQVIDANPDPETVDERIIVFVPEGDLRQGVRRADIEAAAQQLQINSISRLQNGKISGRDGAFDLPAASTGLPRSGVATYLGIRGADAVTSGNQVAQETRTLVCEDGFHGTGITESRTIERVTTLGGDVTETPGAWIEIARSCAPDYSEQIRFFDACPGGQPGEAVFEATQYIRKDPSNPFATETFIDTSTKTLVGEGECFTGNRARDAKNFLVEGGTTASRELQLKTRTTAADIGSGVGKVPAEVSGSGSQVPVSGIPFPATSKADFEFIRSCAAEFGPISLPAGYSGPSTFSGQVTWYRDYNRRETYFSDSSNAYILNYDVVLDPNPYGWAAKGRRTIPTTHGSAPTGNGWYRAMEVCNRTLTRPELQDATRQCSNRFSTYPLGTLDERRTGVGSYNQVRGQTPTLISISWGAWNITDNRCYRQTVTKSYESRVIEEVVGSQTCKQRQVRTRIDTKTSYMTGTSKVTTTYDPNWTDSGTRYGCVSNYSSSGGGGGGGGGGQSYIDVDGDGRGDFSSIQEAERNGFTGNSGIAGNYDRVGNYGRSSAVQGQVDYTNSQRSSGSNSSGGSTSCFAAGTPVLMADGSERAIEDICIGDILAEGGQVYMTGAFLADDLWLLDGVQVTGSHLVRSESGWVAVCDHPRAIRLLEREQVVYNLATLENRIVAGGLVFADYAEIAGPLVEDLLAARLCEIDAMAA